MPLNVIMLFNSSGLEEGVFCKSVDFLEILEKLESLGFLQIPQSMESQGDSDSR